MGASHYSLPMQAKNSFNLRTRERERPFSLSFLLDFDVSFWLAMHSQGEFLEERVQNSLSHSPHGFGHSPRQTALHKQTFNWNIFSAYLHVCGRAALNLMLLKQLWQSEKIPKSINLNNSIKLIGLDTINVIKVFEKKPLLFGAGSLRFHCGIHWVPQQTASSNESVH